MSSSRIVVFVMLLIPGFAFGQTREADACFKFVRPYFTTARANGGVNATAVVRLANFNVAKEGSVAAPALHPSSGEAIHLARFSGWKYVAGDSVEVAWRNGFYGPVFRGEMRGDSLLGYVRHTTDDGLEPPAEQTRALRVTCPT